MNQDSVFPSVTVPSYLESHTRNMIPNAWEKGVKFPQYVMVLGCMSATNVRMICFLKRSINAAAYQNVLNHFFIPYIENKFEDNESMFQQRLTLPHTAKSSEWFRVKRIPVLGCSSNSPDANPIMNLCGILKRRLRKFYPSNLEELKRVITKLWASVSPETCDLIGSLP